MRLITMLLGTVALVLSVTCVTAEVRITGIVDDHQDYNNNKVPFEAVFQGLCKDSDICAHTCFNLHDGTFECNCHPGYTLDANGYSCSKINDSNSDASVLYEKEASFVAVLDDTPEYQQQASQQSTQDSIYNSRYDYDYPKQYMPRLDEKYSFGYDDVKTFEEDSEAGKSPKINEFTGYERRATNSFSYDETYDSNYDGPREEPRVLPDHEAPPEDINSDDGFLDLEDLQRYFTTEKPYTGDLNYNSEDDDGLESVMKAEDSPFMKSMLPSSDDPHSSRAESFARSVPLTSPGPNLEQKVPSEVPTIHATQSLLPQCSLDCGAGRCSSSLSNGSNVRCQCPLGSQGTYCRPAPRIDTARFHGQSWVGFAPLREAYKDVQITIEFKPELTTEGLEIKTSFDDIEDTVKFDKPNTLLRYERSYDAINTLVNDGPESDIHVDESMDLSDDKYPPPSKNLRKQEGLRGSDASRGNGLNAVLLVSGENDDLSGDFMAAVIVDGIIEFRWDCGSGPGVVRSEEPVKVGQWNRLSVYRHRWDVWLQLNDGQHVQGRSEGLFSRITFREPLYVGGSYNLTSLHGRLGVTQGLTGCVRRLQVNDHIYQFFKASSEANLASDYGAIDGWDISECLGDACFEVQCENGGKCISSAPPPTEPPTAPPAVFTPIAPKAVCLCPLGFSGDMCETTLNLEVPAFNGTSHLVMPALGSSLLSWLELEVVFRSSAMDGSIVYAGHRSDASGDFISLSLADAHVLFTIDLGSGPTTLRSQKPIRPGIWHSVHISRTSRRVWMYVDDQVPIEGMTPGGFTMLSLSEPTYIGGLPQDSAARKLFTRDPNFQGCIQKMVIGGRLISLVSSAISGHNVRPCNHPCSDTPCSNGGVCEPLGPSYSCKCPMGFTDEHCRSRVVTQASTPRFGGKSFLKFTHPEVMKRVTGDKLHMWFRFKSSASTGLLVWIGEDNFKNLNDPYLEEDLLSLSLGDCLSLELKDGKLVLRYNLGSGFAVLNYNSNLTYDDGAWHVVRLARFERQAQMTVDDGPELISFSPGDLVQLNVDSALYIGGRETYHSGRSGSSPPGLVGCVADLTLATDYHVDLVTMATAGQNIEYC